MRMSRGLLTRTVSLVLVGALTFPTIAWADEPTPAAMEEARHRYDRALELSDEGNYDEALLELQRAYSLAPTYRLLYNLGVVSVAVHDYVSGIDYYTRYLQQGGAEVEASRVKEVQNQIDRLRSRVARLRVYPSVASAEVSVDDVLVHSAPDQPVVLNPGRHRVSVSAPGYFPATSSVELAGNDSKSISVTLQAVSANQEKPSHPIPWVGWAITGALAAGATVTGILTLNASSNYDTKVNTLGASGDDVASSYRTMRALSVTTDALIVGAVIAAGVSFYFTIKPVKAKPKTGFQMTPTGIAF